jgi:DNA-binding beta-propeller fold protein YncE
MRLHALVFLLFACPAIAQTKKPINLPSSKVLLAPAPGRPQTGVGSLPVAVALSPDRRYLAILDGGFGRPEFKYQQGIGVLDLATNKATFYPDARFGNKARQSYFLGLAFSADGRHLFASVGSLTDPLATFPGSTGNGVAVYRFDSGRVVPERFIFIPPQALAAGKRRAPSMKRAPPGTAVPFPAGLAVIAARHTRQMLVADNLSDDVLQFDLATGKILRRFDLSTTREVPSAYPYAVVANRAGTRAWVSLWNASRVAELDLSKGRVLRWISLHDPASPTRAGSHPNALLLAPDEKFLFAALANADEVAVIDTDAGKVTRYLSTRLPGQKFLGAIPKALAETQDGKRLFVANAGSDAVAVFDFAQRTDTPAGFIPTEWYPTALAVDGGDLLIASGKSQGTGPNSAAADNPQNNNHPYIASLLHGSVARVSIGETEKNLDKLTREVEESNLMNGRSEAIVFHDGSRCGPDPRSRSACKIQHIIYVIKENRTYDQIFGDLGVGDGDPSLTMYGEAITPNEHKLARQFGVLDNFYDSGEVSGDGHVWSTAAITSDYTEMIWPIAYRGKERTYDFEGRVNEAYPLHQGIPDVNEPGTGYLWASVARHGLTYRHYGEFVSTSWCDKSGEGAPPGEAGTPLPPPGRCERATVLKGEPLPENGGDPPGSPSPYPWPVPRIAFNTATKPELRGHFDEHFADFRLDYPDQLRADEFLHEFAQFVGDRRQGKDTFPAMIVLRLPNDHTIGTRPGMPCPAASVADNDLAVGRVVDAVSHSPYWDNTAILILEDDAQNGADHVDAHRSLALVISKYSPPAPTPFVDHRFYTTVNVIRTMEVLLGLPPMNNNDAHAAVIAPLFSGAGDQQPFTADYRNRDNGLLYEVNPPNAQGAAASLKMDFSHADAADSSVLNRILWRDVKGDTPMPAPRHTIVSRHPRTPKDD